MALSRISDRGIAFMKGKMAWHVPIVFAALILLVVIATPQPALACSCIRPDPEEFLKSADVVFAGEVVKVDQIWRYMGLGGRRSTATAVARADTIWKGDIGRAVEFHYWTDEGTCGLWLDEGETGVFVLASTDRGLTTGSCLFRWRLGVAEIVRVLGEGRSP